MLSDDDESSGDLITRRKNKRIASDNDSEEVMDLDFTIMDFTKYEVQLGSSTKYIVIDDDCRE